MEVLLCDLCEFANNFVTTDGLFHKTYNLLQRFGGTLAKFNMLRYYDTYLIHSVAILSQARLRGFNENSIDIGMGCLVIHYHNNRQIGT